MHNDQTPTHQGFLNRELDELLESRYKELFGEDNLKEDIPLVEEFHRTHIEKINKLETPIIPDDIQFERAMSDYRRDKDADITRYNFFVEINFPPTMRCVPTPGDEESLEIQINPEEEAAIEGDTHDSANN